MKLKILFCFLFLTSITVSYAAKISLQIAGKSDNNPAILSLPNGKEHPITIDKLGKGRLTLDITEPVYVELYYQYVSRTLLLTPNTDIHISFESNRYGETIQITGTDAQINRYLNSGRLQAAVINDSKLNEQAYFIKADSLFNANLQELGKAGLAEQFNKIETVRLKYFTYASLPDYPYFHIRIAQDSTYKASAYYWKRLKELMVMDASLLKYKEFRTFINESAVRVAKQQYPTLSYLNALIKYVESDVTEPLIAEFLINNNLYAYIEKNGAEAAKAYSAVFKRYVKSPNLLKAFDELCNQWNRLSVGSPSPDFNCTDISGKKFSLSNFRGKYLYIDIWATWCAPCQREIPYMRQLEERYHNKEIYFVSISCDSNRAAWENMVKSGMKGIQLHFVTGDTFMSEYMINGIPRFILLDKEGRIISADMTRPSNSATITKLDQLLN